MKVSILTIEVRIEQDVVHARQRARQIAQLLGFDLHGQTRVATAVSEIARNAFQYGGGAKVEFSVQTNATGPSKQAFVIQIEDRGPGISNLKEILDGHYISKTGLGLGIVGAKRLMDQFQIQPLSGGGTQIQLWKELPDTVIPVSPEQIGKMAQTLTQPSFESPLEEVQRQNQELLRMMEIVKSREAELAKANETLITINRELEETNRGVVALYTELDEKASALKKANEVKTRFLSYMSHEFRTPLNSIIGLSRLLLDRLDGDLTSEQEKQIGFILNASEDVLEMVNDLLDLSKAEAGKIEIKPKRMQLSDVFSALKGLMRPLLTSPSVELIFEGSERIPELYSDEGKIQQILRNLISNSLKFTEKGKICISAQDNGDGTITLSVTDTGIGIAAEHQQRIFEEYSQIDSLFQRRAKGTGLGLPLVKKLTELLGGKISVKSQLGKGSTFAVTLPMNYTSVKATPPVPEIIQTAKPTPEPDSFPTSGTGDNPTEVILIIDDEKASRYLLRGLLPETQYRVIEAESGKDGIQIALKEKPFLIFLDFLMPEMGAFEVIEALKMDSLLKTIPVAVRTSKVLTPEERSRLEEKTIAILSKETQSREDSIKEIKEVLLQIKRRKEDQRKEKTSAA